MFLCAQYFLEQIKYNNNLIFIFIYLLKTLSESDFLFVAYLVVANSIQPGILVCYFLARSQYLVRFPSLCLITGSYTVPPTKGLLNPTIKGLLSQLVSKQHGSRILAEK